MTVTINGVSPTTAQQREFAAAMGLPVLLQTVTVGTAQQDIDFTSLDLDADVRYRIELTVSVHSAAAQDVFIYYNNDLTAANYSSQVVLGDGTAATVSRQASAFGAVGGSPTATGVSLCSTITATKVAAKTPMLISQSGYYSGANAVVVNSFSHRWSSTANVTSIKLRNPNNFGVGTVAKIYKI